MPANPGGYLAKLPRKIGGLMCYLVIDCAKSKAAELADLVVSEKDMDISAASLWFHQTAGHLSVQFNSSEAGCKRIEKKVETITKERALQDIVSPSAQHPRAMPELYFRCNVPIEQKPQYADELGHVLQSVSVNNVKTALIELGKKPVQLGHPGLYLGVEVVGDIASLEQIEKRIKSWWSKDPAVSEKNIRLERNGF